MDPAKYSRADSLVTPAGKRTSELRKRREERSKPSLLDIADLEKLKELTLPEAFKAPNLFQVFFQTIYTMQYEIAKSRAGSAHVTIHPDLSGFAWTELHRARELVGAGEKVAEAVLPKLKGLLPYFSDYCQTDIRTSPWEV